MKNIQVIDGAINCTYDIYSVSDDVFKDVFPGDGQNIEFAEDLFERLGQKNAAKVYGNIWKIRVNKTTASGIHGTLFVGLLAKKKFYPTKRESDLDQLRARPVWASVKCDRRPREW